MTGLAAGLAGLAILVLLRPAGASARLHRLRPVRTHSAVRGPTLVVGALAVLAVALTGAVLAAALVALASPVVLRLLRSRTRAALLQEERARALEALALLAAELRAGRPAAAVLEGAAEVAAGGSRAALSAAAGAARLGGDVPVALRSVPSGVPTWTALATCWQVCGGFGHGLAASVERLEQGLRAAEDQRRALDAELAGPRATAGLLAVLPLAGIGLAAALGADPLRVLLQTPVGLTCLVIGLAADLAGWQWTQALVRRASAA